MMAPLLLTFVVLVVTAGRVVQSKGDASDVAYAAARAASLSSSPGEAKQAAQRAADDAVAAGDLSCRGVSVQIDASQFEPGGQVTATARCDADLVDVAGFGVPSNRTFVASAAVPIEQFRDLS